MNNIALWILEVFFGAFAINGTFKFYLGDGLSKFHCVMWFISIVIFAIITGKLFG